MKTAKLLLLAMIFSTSAFSHVPKNIYFGLRHGESVPSKEKRVCASMEAGILCENGLTAEGRVEVEKSAAKWVKEGKSFIAKYVQENRLIILSSPFCRTLETAFFFASAIEKEFPEHKPSIEIENDLRERDFGDFEGQLQSDAIYQRVWNRDREDPAHTDWNVESAQTVQKRTRELMARLENTPNRIYVLVAHGDTLSLMETGFKDLDASLHRNANLVKPFQTAEFRLFGHHDGLCMH